MTEALWWAFLHVFHEDKANAAMHCADVRFSPITFHLYEALAKGEHRHDDEVMEVGLHVGAYEVDRGR